MNITILTANLGNFDTPIDPVLQDVPIGYSVDFYRFTDENFPPITGLTPRFQYRIPKLFGWEMKPDSDVYIWLDGSVSFKRSDCVQYFLNQLGTKDAAFFKHPVRRTIRQEAEHIEEKLTQNHWYITPRYKNGLHKEQVRESLTDKEFKDDTLYTSTVFIYRNNTRVHEFMKTWWYYQSRYYTCDQIALPYALFKSKIQVNRINENQYKIGYVSLVSHHK